MLRQYALLITANKSSNNKVLTPSEVPMTESSNVNSRERRCDRNVNVNIDSLLWVTDEYQDVSLGVLDIFETVSGTDAVILSLIRVTQQKSWLSPDIRMLKH